MEDTDTWRRIAVMAVAMVEDFKEDFKAVEGSITEEEDFREIMDPMEAGTIVELEMEEDSKESVTCVASGATKPPIAIAETKTGRMLPLMAK